MSEIELSVYMPLIVDILGVILIWGALITDSLGRFNIIYRLAMAITGIGFLWQIHASVQVLFFAGEIGKTQPPLWMLKDLGVVLLLSKAYYDIHFKGKHLEMIHSRRLIDE